MKFKVNPKIFEDFNQPVIGVIIAAGINKQNDKLQIQKLFLETKIK